MRVTVDPDYPDAWLREPYYRQIRQWAQQKPVEIPNRLAMALVKPRSARERNAQNTEVA
jgi:hypothetical protein